MRGSPGDIGAMGMSGSPGEPGRSIPGQQFGEIIGALDECFS